MVGVLLAIVAACFIVVVSAAGKESHVDRLDSPTTMEATVTLCMWFRVWMNVSSSSAGAAYFLKWIFVGAVEGDRKGTRSFRASSVHMGPQGSERDSNRLGFHLRRT